MLFVLGTRDQPTDGVYDLCTQLCDALRRCGAPADILEVDWNSDGWKPSLREFAYEGAALRPDWVLVQHTHLTWSNKGFLARFRKVVDVAEQMSHGNVGVMIHDPTPFTGRRLRDRLRRFLQVRAMRKLIAGTRLAFVTVPPGAIGWMTEDDSQRVTWLPIGSNIPVSHPPSSDPRPFTLSVFGITERSQPQAELLARVVNRVAARVQPMRFVAVGRGTEEAREHLERLLHESIDLVVAGLVPEEEVSAWLSRSDVYLHIRGEVATRRGSIMAAVAHGVPVVGFTGPETHPRFEEVGAVLIDDPSPERLADSIIGLAQDRPRRQELRERSIEAVRTTFSFDNAARIVLDRLGCDPVPPDPGA